MKSSFVIRHFGHRPTRLWRALFLIPFSLSFLIMPNLVQAQILPACTATGNCGICDFLDTLTNIIRWVLGIVGGSALLLMVWHGFSWITSGGNKEKVDSARKGMLHTVIGIIIILGAWQIINMVVVMLVNEPGEMKAGLFKDNTKIWFEYCGRGQECQGRGNGSPCGNGNFCYNQKCEQALTINSQDIENACDFWSKYYDVTQMGGFNPYSEYKCLAECDPYENLGAAYCPQNSSNEQISCCKPKADNSAAGQINQ